MPNTLKPKSQRHATHAKKTPPNPCTPTAFHNRRLARPRDRHPRRRLPHQRNLLGRQTATVLAVPDSYVNHAKSNPHCQAHTLGGALIHLVGKYEFQLIGLCHGFGSCYSSVKGNRATLKVFDRAFVGAPIEITQANQFAELLTA